MASIKKYSFKLKKAFQKIRQFWDYVWNGDDITSWILSIIIAFIIIRFMFYPVLGVFLGTTHPIVAVVSDSMTHNDNFNEWWNENFEFYHNFEISKSDFENFNFKNGFNKGDILILTGRSKNIKAGNVIVFQSKEPYPIIHRVIRVLEIDNQTIFQTKGDNNEGLLYREFDGRSGLISSKILTYEDLKNGVFEKNHPEYIKVIIDESNINEEDFIGNAIIKIPYLGYVKIWFVEFIVKIGLVDFFSYIGIIR